MLGTMIRSCPRCVAFLSRLGVWLSRVAQDSENNTILILLAEIKRPPVGSNTEGSDILGAALRMARLYYERYPYILDWSNSSGRTALHVAAMTGKDDMVRVRCKRYYGCGLYSDGCGRCCVITARTLI